VKVALHGQAPLVSVGLTGTKAETRLSVDLQVRQSLGPVPTAVAQDGSLVRSVNCVHNIVVEL